jgi:hypothetical protein
MISMITLEVYKVHKLPSLILPLSRWTPVVIGIFVACRFITGQCSVQSVNDLTPLPLIAAHKCTALEPFLDALLRTFNFLDPLPILSIHLNGY